MRIEIRSWNQLRNIILRQFDAQGLSGSQITKKTGHNFYPIIVGEGNRPRIDLAIMWCHFFGIKIYVEFDKDARK